MRRHFLTIAVVVTGAAAPAQAQKGSWGDGHAAVFNAPMGYSSQAGFSGIENHKTQLAHGKRKQSRPKSGLDNICEDSVDRTAPSLGSRSSEGQIFALNHDPCAGASGASPTLSDSSFRGTLTVTTTGAWNTSIVENKRQAADDRASTLNGGLNLD